MKRRWLIVGLPLFATVAVIWFLATRPDGEVTVRFLGYTEGRPYAEMSPAVLGAQVSPQQTMRVAQLSISNGTDFPVSALLTVRYTNGAWGAFVPPNVQVAPHAVANVRGVIIPTAGNGPPTNYPSSPDWTKPWRLKAYTSGGPLSPHVTTFRDKVSLWLFQHHSARLGLLVSPRKVQRIETDLISPDATSAQ